MITLVGVGHVFDIERQVRHVIQQAHPDAVGVELDPSRYEALRHPSGTRSAPLPYRLLAMTQKRLARNFDGKVGQEMLAAVDEGQHVGAQVLFIDVDAASMFRQLWSQLPLKEKVMILLSGLTGLVAPKRYVEGELERFEENEVQYLDLLGKELPTLKKVLIDDRNQVMAQRIMGAEQQFPHVLAVVGDGHVEGISSLLGRPDVHIVRLRELRQMIIPEVEATGGSNEVTIRFEVGPGQV